MKGKKMNCIERKKKIESDINERKRVFKELCNHLKEGLSMECFSDLSIPSIKLYLQKYPDEFKEELIEKSFREGRNMWENIGRSQSNGSCLGNSRSWYYNMANRYGWREKLEVEAEHKGNVNINVVSYASKKSSQ